MSVLAHLRCVGAVLLGVGIPLGACNDADCNSYVLEFQYPTPSASSTSCTVIVSGPSASAVEDVLATDDAPCADNCPQGTCPCVDCTATSGPPPLYCNRYLDGATDTISVQFEQPGSSPLASFTGASTMLVTVMCGGVTIVHDDPQTERCIHGL